MRTTHAQRQGSEDMKVLYDGLNISQLEKAFERDKRTINQALASVEPDGYRNGVPIWRISTAAQYLVKPSYSVEHKLRRMNPRDLPPMLQKEFWDAMSRRMKFLEDAGDLWRTDSVISMMSECFQTFKMECRLTADAVGQNVELSKRQRDIVVNLIDGMMENIRRGLVTQFQDDEKGNYADEVKEEITFDAIFQAEDDSAGADGDTETA